MRPQTLQCKSKNLYYVSYYIYNKKTLKNGKILIIIQFIIF